jgi:hypothetical protein
VPGLDRGRDEGAEPSVRAPEPSVPWWEGPWGRRLLLEIVTIAGVYLIYKQVRFLARDQELQAVSNAMRVVRFERATGLFTELDLQRFVLDRETLVHLLDRYYVSVHFPLTVGIVVWAYARHRDSTYGRLKFLLLSVTAAGLLVHVAFPLAPPRMLPHLGFVDTLAEYGPRIYSTDPRRSVANQFAAMPSLHFGWAVIVAWSVASTTKNRWARLLWIHPFVTLMAITATANHYWLDSIVAGAMVLAAYAVLRAREGLGAGQESRVTAPAG